MDFLIFRKATVFFIYIYIFYVWTCLCFSWDSRNLRVPHVSSPSSPQVCLGCAELSPEFRCSGCRVARFCSKAEGRRCLAAEMISKRLMFVELVKQQDFFGDPPFWWSNGFLGTPHFETFFKYSWLIKVEKTRFLLVPHHVGLPAACGKATSAFLFEGSGLGLSVPKAIGN